MGARTCAKPAGMSGTATGIACARRFSPTTSSQSSKSADSTATRSNAGSANRASCCANWDMSTPCASCCNRSPATVITRRTVTRFFRIGPLRRLSARPTGSCRGADNERRMNISPRRHAANALPQLREGRRCEAGVRATRRSPNEPPFGYRSLRHWLWADICDGASMRRGFPSLAPSFASTQRSATHPTWRRIPTWVLVGKRRSTSLE